MVDRTDHILSCMMKANGPLTSVQLAEALGVSSRTVKASMPRVAQSLEEHGAKLCARRNAGYWIEAVDEKTYKEFRDKIGLRALNISMAGYDHEARVLHVERRLVASPDGARIDQICEELALSRSAVRSVLKEAIAFCESFHLQVSSAPGRGMSVVGEEHMIRLALMELFEIHFNTFKPDLTTREYAQWIDCGYQERQDIRHEFLRILRSSGFSMRDTATQRISMYFIIARNRIKAGFDILLPAAWIKEIEGSACWALAKQIYNELSKSIEGFDASRDEVAFFAMLLLRNMDVVNGRNLSSIAPDLYPIVHRVTTTTIRLFQETTGISLTGAEMRPFIEQFLLPLVAAKRYGMDGCELFENDAEHSVVDPISMYLGFVFGSIIGSVIGCRMSKADVRFAASVILYMLRNASVPIRPLCLLVTSVMGTAFAQKVADALAERYPTLIKSAKGYELYEIRGIDPDAYDAVVTDVSWGYRYDAPVASYCLHTFDQDFGGIYNKILVRAFDLDGYVPGASSVSVTKGIRFSTPAQLVQTLSLVDGKRGDNEYEAAEELERQMSIAEQTVRNHRAFLFRLIPDEADESIDWYVLEKPMSLGAKKVASVLYARLHRGADLVRFMAYERIWSQMERVPSDWIGTPEMIAALFKDLLKSSFMLELCDGGQDRPRTNSDRLAEDRSIGQ
jgi:biotin operon repressor